MDFFVGTSFVPGSYRVLRDKDELLAEISKMVSESVDNGCTYFDLIINTDADKKHPAEKHEED
jgi:hypothetical protein